VLIANRDKVDSLATDLLAAIDKEIQELPVFSTVP
jgi:hypothetical protein